MKVDWSKYTLDEWLEQFGAWCRTCNMNSGHCPDNLQVNLIDKLMIEAGYKLLPSHKNTIECKISDFEADEFNYILSDVLKSTTEIYVKFALICLIKHKIDGKSLLTVGEETRQSKGQVNIMVNLARGVIYGKYPFFILKSD